MFCKFCGTELNENSTVCVNCGKDNEEKPIKKKVSPIKVTVAAVCIVALLASLGAMIFYGVTGRLGPKENDIFYKDSYTVSDEELMTKLDDVVATVGESKMTNSQMQVFYWMQIINLGGYGNYYGIDYSKPLNDQVFDKQTGKTWQQYFLENALESWQQYQILTQQADAAGYKLPEEYQSYMDNLEEELTEAAKEYKYDSALDMLKADMGAGVTLEDYREYLRLYYTANLYFSDLVDKLEATQEEIEAYYQANPSALTTSWNVTVNKETGKLVDVRHILIQPTGGTKNDKGETVYSDDEWEACRQAAQKILDEYLAGDKTEEAFGELAKKNTADSNKDEGGLYTDVTKGIMVKEFEDWCFEEGREHGNTGLVKTDFGYHIMYFVGSEEAWIRCSRNGVISEKSNKLLEGVTESIPMEVDYKSIALGFVDLSTN